MEISTDSNKRRRIRMLERLSSALLLFEEKDSCLIPPHSGLFTVARAITHTIQCYVDLFVFYRILRYGKISPQTSNSLQTISEKSNK